MNNMVLHPIQRDILNILLYSKEARFTDLNLHHLSNDHFSFHIKKLISKEIIEKNSEGNYHLTNTGKDYVTSIDFIQDTQEKRAKVIGLIVCKKEVQGVDKFLLQKRLRQPYYNYYGLPTTRVARGSKFQDVTKSEFQDNTGLTCDLKLVGVEHKMDYFESTKELLEDNVFFVYEGSNIQGELKTEFYGGMNQWMSIEEIKNEKLVFGNVDWILSLYGNDSISFAEKDYHVDVF